jgi:hypothetical protein
MNNTFELNRFKKLIDKDFNNYFKTFGPTLAVLIAIQVAVWILSTVWGIPIDSSRRQHYMQILLAIAIIAAPEKAYAKANLKRYGNEFATLPASALEKFMSMFIYCTILTPILFLAGYIILDSLLTYLPFGSYEVSVLDNIKRGLYFNKLFEDETSTRAMAIIGSMAGFFAISALLLFGNMIFKKHKTVKMIGSILIGLFLISLIFIVIINMANNLNIDVNSKEQLILSLKQVTIFNIFLGCAMSYATFYKIKTQKY